MAKINTQKITNLLNQTNSKLIDSDVLGFIDYGDGSEPILLRKSNIDREKVRELFFPSNSRSTSLDELIEDLKKKIKESVHYYFENNNEIIPDDTYIEEIIDSSFEVLKNKSKVKSVANNIDSNLIATTILNLEILIVQHVSEKLGLADIGLIVNIVAILVYTLIMILHNKK